MAENLPYIVAALSTLTLLTYFWTLRLADNPSLQAGVAPPPSPLRFVSRFISQPRLVLSWMLALGRNGWWVMNFIYTPIYVTNAGYARRSAERSSRSDWRRCCWCACGAGSARSSASAIC